MAEWTESDLTRMLAATVLLSSVIVILLGLTPTATSDPHTEFYILGPDETASGYPTNLSVDESGTVLVGLSNQEGKPTTYTVALRFDGEWADLQIVTLQQEETWEQNMSFTPRSPGREQLQILLFHGESAESATDATQRLRLWIDVNSTNSRHSMYIAGDETERTR